ncbi:MAG: hypothetical protein U0W40_06315 [Acidimicrobiia bacterium]
MGALVDPGVCTITMRSAGDTSASMHVEQFVGHRRAVRPETIEVEEPRRS